MEKEYRSFSLVQAEVEQDAMIIEGKAVTFNTPTMLYEKNGIKYYEVIDSRAFDGVSLNDVVLLVNHEGKPAARTLNNTLQLELRNDGLYVKADLSKNATGRELYEDIQNGFFQTMSFAFNVAEEDYNINTRTRTVKKIKTIYDVSAVDFPAYKSTSIACRSIQEAEEEFKKAEELRRKKLILKTYL